ncbi:MAG TPA: hypothetical protein PKK40_09460 [Marmoricola sp.]|nr:hypothetical protein [Marmoricola sp.]
METNPQEQLDLIRKAKADAAAKAVAPRWYYPALGLLMSAYLCGIALVPPRWFFLVLLPLCLALLGLITAYRRQTGIWVTATTGRALAWSVVLIVIYVAVLIAAMGLRNEIHPAWVVLLIFATCLPASLLLGRVIERETQSGIREGRSR